MKIEKAMVESKKVEELCWKMYDLSGLPEHNEDDRFSNDQYTIDELLELCDLIGKRINSFRDLAAESKAIGCENFKKQAMKKVDEFQKWLKG